MKRLLQSLASNVSFRRSRFDKKLSALRIVHACHHKTGTVWLKRVLKSVSEEFGWTFQCCKQKELKTETQVFLEGHSRLDLKRLPPFRGSHMIRDPRDVVISGYYYHKVADEPWLHIPRRKYQGLSYQEYLTSLDEVAGIIAEMRSCRNSTIRHMLEWNYDNPCFLELTYEETLNCPEEVFTALFNHYGLGREETPVAVRLALSHTLTRTEVADFHVRNGQARQWVDFYTPELKSAYQEIMEDAHTKLGYPDW